MSATDSVTSADGTIVGFERDGAGVPLGAVHGGTADRTRWAPVRDALAMHFELFLVDRRGRGLSTDERGPYDLTREGEDLVAVLAEAGGPAVLVAHSYGGLAALEAARRTDHIGALVLYEPAAAARGHAVVEDELLALFEDRLAEDDREGMLELFFTEVIGLPPAAVEEMRGTPIWQARLGAIHTMVREGRAANAFDLRPERWAALTVPTTVLMGTESAPWLQAAARAAHEALPTSRFVELEGQGHMAIDLVPDRFVAEVRTAATLAGLLPS
jgi:pimeloyl-ACP methyl ester carboxylesterase